MIFASDLINSQIIVGLPSLKI